MQHDDCEWTRLPSAPDMPSSSSWFPRRPSIPSSLVPGSKLRRKDRALTADDPRFDDFGSNSSHSHLPHASTLPSRNRAGILSAASDALGLRKKAARKKPSPSPTGTPLPEVIEISARNNTTVTASVAGTTAHRDYEHEERERLRDAAAQSIGLGPALFHDPCKSESRLSLDSLAPSPQPASIPSFPATVAALCPFTTLSATLPKFTPPSSLLVYALAKQWKPRTIVLTSHSSGHKTHVHLFKGTAKDEKEIERLEVTEDSVIFVAEEEVGGRGNVIKLGGKDVSARRGGTGEHSQRTMWFLQITDPAESQRWIAAIKSAVLSRRAVRVGIDIPPQSIGKNEPKGDMDVMLSMHLQGIMAARPSKPSPTMPAASPPMAIPPSPPASLRSLRISIPSSSSPSTAVKGIISGTRPRSPSVDGSIALPSPSGQTEDSFGLAGTSLLSMLRTKSSVDSSSSPSHSLPLPVPHVLGRGSPAPSLRSAMAPVVIGASELKISRERDTPESSSTVPDALFSMPGSNTHTPLIPSLAPQGTLTLSLQPPPRKPKCAPTTFSATGAPELKAMYTQTGGNRSVAGNFGIPSRGSGVDSSGETSPVSPTFSSVHSASFLPSFNIRPPPPSDEAHGSEENDKVDLSLPGNGALGGGYVPTDKLLQTTAISKRWSRQGAILPKQLTPPLGPPPSIPLSSENNPRTSMESSKSLPVTSTSDRSPSISSSNSRSRGPLSAKSGSSSLSPTFWKRVSASSTYSVSSTGTTDSRGRSLVPLSSGGESNHSSSLKSVLAIGVPSSSSRPMSICVTGSLPLPHVATLKRRSMPPPRPAPNFAPPPAPAIQESSQPGPSTVSASAPQKSFRSSIAQRALRLSLTSPKPPPCSALPPRPDDPVIPRIHRRSSSTGTPDLYSVVALPSRPSSALSGNANSNPPISPPSRNLSIRQRLRILSTPSTSRSSAQSPSSTIPSLQVSSLDLSDDNDDDLPTPYFHSSQSFGLGEPIMTIRKNPSFLQLSNTESKSLPDDAHQAISPSSGWGTPPLEPDREFLSLSPPPPRRGSKPLVTTAARTGNVEAGENESAPHEENSLMLSQRGSVVSLGFVTT